MKHVKQDIPPWFEALTSAEILDVVVDGVCALDASGRIVFWNSAAEAITGFSRAEAIGRPPDFLEGLGCPGFRKLTELLGRRGSGEAEARGMECRVRIRGDRTARLHGNARVVRGRDGKPKGAIACFVDLSESDRERERAEALESDLLAERGFGRLVGRSEAMKRVLERMRLAARSDATVLVTGESGTGKELVARAIHDASPRGGRGAPFVAVHCSALPEALLESELFGHVRGAFTGASADAKGRFELADGGTLFLDEIGELTPLVQVKLLRALEQREIERVGEGRPRKVDVRVVAATHRDLKRLVAEGAMREDFYYRIRVFPIELPPLRERREDVPVLATALLEAARERGDSGKRAAGFSPEAMRRLVAAPWPGNVRELRNAVEYACVVARGERIEAEDLPPDLEEEAGAAAARPEPAPRRAAAESDVERALRECGGRVGAAARRLGISRVTLWRRRRRTATGSGKGKGKEPRR